MVNFPRYFCSENGTDHFGCALRQKVFHRLYVMSVKCGNAV